MMKHFQEFEHRLINAATPRLVIGPMLLLSDAAVQEKNVDGSSLFGFFRSVAVLIVQPTPLNVPREEAYHHPHRSFPPV